MTKQKKLRHSEYYDLQDCFDELYAKSKQGDVFTNLMEVISSEENIRLAYRNIKHNSGSYTSGVDKLSIKDIERLSTEKLVEIIQRKFKFYKPKPVKRVEIPKPNGKTRPLGIPTIVDRLVQQCILQVLEPICEAKFHERSNGFRPNRSAEHALAQCYRMIQIQNLHFVVDVDIKGFFDNVNHSKLIRQMWALGIRDKQLICIIKEMLKAPVAMPDGSTQYPTKGTPQGGILSPLLANIVLNELDWWISSQWENMITHSEYQMSYENGTANKNNVYRALRNSRLKEMYMVRYADDFKIFCRKRSDADKAFIAVKQWLKDRLSLEISDEKSKVVNLKKHYSEFLGFKLKAVRKGGKFVVRSHMSEQMAFRCPNSKVVGTSEIKDFELEFRGVATIVPKENASVPVLIWELDERDLPTLNRYEGWPRLYRQEKMSFELNGKTCEGMAYLMNCREISPPSQQYYNTILQGYRENGLDESYLQTALENSIRQEQIIDDNFDIDEFEDLDFDDDFQMKL